MTTPLKSGQAVSWHWGEGTAQGEIAEVHTKRVSRTIKGKRITRNATPEKPAYLIRQEDGAKVLKSHSEVEKG